MYTNIFKLFFCTFKANLIFSFSFSVIVITPAYFAIEVKKISDMPTETKGFWTFNYFGQTSFFKYYSVILLLFETVIPITILTLFNVMSVHKFRKLMKQKMRIQQNKNRIKKAEKANLRFTKLIIALTFICIVTRTIDSSSSIFLRMTLLFKIDLTENQTALLNLVKIICMGLLFSAHALD
jgi:hypothetical protein